MTGEFIVSKLKNLSPIEGADNIQQAKMFGETVIVPKIYKEGDIGLMFDCETALSHSYAHYNNLYREKTLNSCPDVTGYFESHRRVRAIKLKGVKCSAMWMPLNSINNIPELKDFDVSELTEGMQLYVVNGERICEKYVAQKTKDSKGNIQGRIKLNITPTFREHVDTDQFMRNSHKIQKGDYLIFTEKVHGTSGRCGYLPVIKYGSSLKFKLSALLFGLNPFKKENLQYNEYDFVVGSRRVVKTVGEERRGYKKGVSGQAYYESDNLDLWTSVSNKLFKDKLNKGETVYFEIVGYDQNGGLIMGSASNKKLEKFLNKKEYKEFITQYGENTHFTYGCKPFEHKVFVYRITMTNEDGVSYDLTWEQVKQRCEQLGVDHVNEIKKLHIPDEIYVDLEREIEWVEDTIDVWASNPSEKFSEHIREGIVLRIENGSPTPLFLKHKSFVFKVLEGIILDKGNIDIEESN